VSLHRPPSIEPTAVDRSPRHARRSALGVGPETPGWGSWDWVGADLVPELARWYDTSAFGWDEFPARDLLVVVKHPLPESLWGNASARPAIVYCPIDRYGSAAEIVADARWLRRCARIVIHCERLRKHFATYARVEYIDHHVKFIGPPQSRWQIEGPILWVGVRTNLPPLVEWVNTHLLPRELVVLTNPENPNAPLRPADYGFSTRNRVKLEVWRPERHIAWLAHVAGAFDIKGADFRSRHKPPAKAIDFLAAGVPLAMNAESSSVEHLRRLGFEVPNPEDTERWFSSEYWEETQRFGAALRELLARERIARRYRRLIDEVLAERGGR
jgi:hypothetical protein